MSEWTISPARREDVQLIVGIASPSGGGKTFSALRLAHGMREVTGGDIVLIDTEHGRGKHYADGFGFQYHHLPFNPPFSPARYLSGAQYAVAQGAKVLIIDSFSHEHEGEGGMLDMHEQQLDKMAGENWKKRQACNGAAWITPKRERQKMIQGLLRLDCHMIWLFRAKEKLDWKSRGRDGLQSLGLMPISSDDIVYETTLFAFLEPNAGGVPSWGLPEKGTRRIVKKPAQFAQLLAERKPLDEQIGRGLAEWARGPQSVVSPAPPMTVQQLIESVPEVMDQPTMNEWTRRYEAVIVPLSQTDKDVLRNVLRNARMAAMDTQTPAWTTENYPPEP